MARVQKSIEVDVPATVAYRQWTQFEEFPRFMDGVDQVVQRGDKFLDWTATVAGQARSWTADIVDQTPDERIAWKAVDGTANAGAVLFQPLGSTRCRIDLTIEADPDGPIEAAGVALGFLDRRVEGDLERFKEFIEDRGAPTGAWAGAIHGNDVERG